MPGQLGIKDRDGLNFDLTPFGGRTRRRGHLQPRHERPTISTSTTATAAGFRNPPGTPSSCSMSRASGGGARSSLEPGVQQKSGGPREGSPRWSRARGSAAPALRSEQRHHERELHAERLAELVTTTISGTYRKLR
jgi:hypothetical protein